tara:strand:+ start:1692 stop:2243 length:552 start_codon:yes stop_codon:yes gene_type:complete
MIFIVTSCSLENSFVQKRKYQRGYYVSIAKKNKSNGLNKASSKKMDDLKELNNVTVIPETEKSFSQKNEHVTIQNRVLKNEIDSKFTSKEKRPNKVNEGFEINKTLANKLKGVKNLNKKINNNTTAKPYKSMDDDLINLVLAVVLVLAIIMLLVFLDGLLGGLLSLILLIVIVVLLLSYFGII